MKSPQDLVVSFIQAMKEIRPDILFSYEYDQTGDRYRIFHSYTDVHADKEFRRMMNQQYSKYFSENSFYSVSVVLNRQMTPYSFVESHIPNEVSSVHSNRDHSHETSVLKLNQRSVEVGNVVDKWCVYSEDDKKINYDLAV